MYDIEDLKAWADEEGGIEVLYYKDAALELFDLTPKQRQTIETIFELVEQIDNLWRQL